MNNEHQTYPADNEQNDIIIYRSKDGKVNVALMTREGKVWLNQMQIAKLFGTSKQSIGQHIAKILKDRELDADSTVKYYFTVATNGRQYKMLYYSLEMILAIGYRVRGVRGVQFRQWATQHLSEYLVKGFTMDDERLKNPDGRPDYFDELLQRIRDIRASEKRFYQKLRDLFKLSSDYEAREKATQMFFAEAQNKLLYAVTGNTAAEIVMQRADATLPNMGLMTWKGCVVRKGDVIIAKNYLVKDEIDKLNLITAKPKAHAFKNEMCFPLTKTKCELKKHPNSKFECFFNDFNRTKASLFLPFPSKLIQDNLVCVLELQE